VNLQPVANRLLDLAIYIGQIAGFNRLHHHWCSFVKLIALKDPRKYGVIPGLP
jgi:hypothetical protein